MPSTDTHATGRSVDADAGDDLGHRRRRDGDAVERQDE
jgi:hypothetical protein